MRLIDENDRQLGVVDLREALKMAYDKGLDLIQVTEKVEPPVCRIMEYGKYLYAQEKREKHHIKTGAEETKEIRLTFAISDHDLETRARQAEKFLQKGNKVKVEMRLRGRENALRNFAEGKIKKFLDILGTLTPTKVERGIKKEMRGLSIIISKSHEHAKNQEGDFQKI